MKPMLKHVKSLIIYDQAISMLAHCFNAGGLQAHDGIQPGICTKDSVYGRFSYNRTGKCGLRNSALALNAHR